MIPVIYYLSFKTESLFDNYCQLVNFIVLCKDINFNEVI
jgi:hypothetical protein